MSWRSRVPAGVEAGPGTYFGSTPKILWDSYGSRLTIGSYTSIGSDVTIFLGGEHLTDSVAMGKIRGKIRSRSKGDVRIGSDVWIGHGASILSGVTIGDGAVVGAFSVVARDVAPYVVVAGNPVKRIKDRFPSDVVEALLKIRWWEWPRRKILRNAALLKSSDVEEFIRKFG